MRKLGYLGSLFGEIWQFARQNKVYWIVPFVLVLGLLFFAYVGGQEVWEQFMGPAGQ